MKRLLISTTALSVAISPLATMPGFAQVLNEDGSITGADGAVLCVSPADPGCDIAGIVEALRATDPGAADALQTQIDAKLAADAAAIEAEAAAAAQAEAALAAEEAAAAEAQAQAEAEARAAAEAEAAAAAEAEAQAQAEAAAAAQAEADAAAQAEAEAAAQQAADEAAAAEAAAQAQVEAEAQAAAEAEAAAAAAAEEQAAAEAAAAEAAAAEAAAQAAAEEAAAAEAADEAAVTEAAPEQEPVVEEPVAEEPAVEEPVAEEPAVEEPVAEEPVADEPAVEEPAVEAPAGEDTVAEDPAAEEPAVEEPAVEETVVEEPVTEEPAAEEAAAEEPVSEEAAEAAAAEEGAAPAEGIIDLATGEVVDPAVAAEAVAEAEAELAISETGELVDPAAGLKTAEPVAEELVEPVDAPVVSETEVESLTQLLTADPTAIDPGALAAAETITAAPAEGTLLAEPDPEALVAAVTETITEESARTSAEEFAAPPRAMADGKKSGLSDLEKAGLLVLGALAVGAIIKNNRAAATAGGTELPQDSRVVSNTGDRVIVLQPDGTYRVLKDDDTVIRRPGSTVRTETFKDGSTRTIVERADGTQVVTIRDATGRVLRRATYDDVGREIILIDDLAEEEVVVVRDLPKPKKKIVISSKDQDAALKRELASLEADRAGRKFSLRQIREIPEVRALAATIDVEPVTFASGSAAVAAKEARNLADLGRVMQELLDENPREVFLIEGHTDATGKAAMNLALSDRRAESVALALTEYFDIPPENMVVQGYGETELLIDTQESEAANRRVEVRVITPLLRSADRG